jgi:hypothetical protein
MWRQVSLVGPYFAQHLSPRQTLGDGFEHGHSPRHAAATLTKPNFAAPVLSSMPPPATNLFQRHPPTFDPFTEPVHSAFTHWRQASSADVSMPDYGNSTKATSSRQVSDPMQIVEPMDRRYESMPMAGAYESLCEALIPSAPANTPQNGGASPATAGPSNGGQAPATPPVQAVEDVTSKSGYVKWV